jgi:hypothetical protein
MNRTDKAVTLPGGAGAVMANDRVVERRLFWIIENLCRKATGGGLSTKRPVPSW